MPTTVFKETCWVFFQLSKNTKKGRMTGVRIGPSDGQTSGRPLYAVWLICRSGEEPRRRLLESEARIVGEGAFVGYVLGSEGSWKAQ